MKVAFISIVPKPWSILRGLLSFLSRLRVVLTGKAQAMSSRVRHHIILRTEYPLQSIGERYPVRPNRDQLIPSIVFQVWAKDSFGRRHAAELEKFRALNPDLAFKLLSHEDADRYMAVEWGDHLISHIYKSSVFWPMKADILRYCLLFDQGGYYFDINKGCSIPLLSLHLPAHCRLLSYEPSLCELLPDLDCVSCFQHPDRYLIQWGFGFVPRDPILERVIDLICAYYPLLAGKSFANPKEAILGFTGPGMFTKAVREVVKAEGKLEGAQAGINFNGHGIPWMPGSEVRYHLSPPYVLARDALIVR